MKTDVLIVGGGPAGAAAALTLLRYTSHKVVVLEGTGYDLPRAGETVSAAVVPFLEYLGVWQQIQQEHRLEAWATQASWGSGSLTTRDFMFTGRGHGWHLDRRVFDATLAAQIGAVGGALLTGRWLRSAVRMQDGWEIQAGGESGRICISARQVIDSTGRRASFAQRQGAHRKVYDRLVGVVGYFCWHKQAEVIQALLVEATAAGWWYTAPLPGGRIVAAFMTDADELRSRKLQEDSFFLKHLSESTYTKARIANASLDSGLHTFAAGTQLLEPCIGPGWVAVGDAACAFDPLSSLGIGHALASGIQGARIVDERIQGGEELALVYPADVQSHVQTFLPHQQMAYAMERRWPDMPFWKRRNKAMQESA